MLQNNVEFSHHIPYNHSCEMPTFSYYEWMRRERERKKEKKLIIIYMNRHERISRAFLFRFLEKHYVITLLIK